MDRSIFTPVPPSYDEVLEVRAGRVAMVRDFLATVTADELAAARKNPWDPAYQETTLGCLHVILEAEWEHHRYAVRDLDAIEAEPTRDRHRAGAGIPLRPSGQRRIRTPTARRPQALPLPSY